MLLNHLEYHVLLKIKKQFDYNHEKNESQNHNYFHLNLVMYASHQFDKEKRHKNKKWYEQLNNFVFSNNLSSQKWIHGSLKNQWKSNKYLEFSLTYILKRNYCSFRG